MASLHRISRSRFWYGSISRPGHKQILRSTGQTEKDKALEVLKEWERVAKGNRPHSAEQARRVLADIVKETLGDFKESCTCQEYVDRWLAAANGTVADSTQQFYKGTLNSWITWLGDRAGKPLDAISQEDIVNWREAEMKRVRSKTVNHRLKAVRAVLRAAMREGFISVNPADGLKAVRTPAKEARIRRPFTREEIQKVLAHADTTWKLMTLAGLQTGQRLGDIARMDWSEVDLKAGLWKLTTGKTGHELRIPLSAELTSDLTVRRDAAGKPVNGPVFPDLVDTLARSKEKVGILSHMFGHILFQANLRTHSPFDRISKGRDKKTKRTDAVHNRRQMQELSFHSLRHTARTWLEEAGQPKAVIDVLIGHEGDTGKIYTTVGEEALRKAAASLAAVR